MCRSSSVLLVIFASLVCLSFCNPAIDPAASFIRNYSFRFINSVQNSTVYFCWGGSRLSYIDYGQITYNFPLNNLVTQYNYTQIANVSTSIQAYYDQTCNTSLAAEISFDEIGETGYYELSFIGVIGNASIQAIECNFSPAPYNPVWKYRLINQVTCNNQLIDLNVTVQYAQDNPSFQLTLPAAKANRTEVPYYVSVGYVNVSGIIPGYSNFSYKFFPFGNPVSSIFLYGNCSNVQSFSVEEDPDNFSCPPPSNNTTDDNDHKDLIIVFMCVGWLLAVVFAILWLIKRNENSRRTEPGMQRINDSPS